jgi:hypothetical protein
MDCSSIPGGRFQISKIRDKFIPTTQPRVAATGNQTQLEKMTRQLQIRLSHDSRDLPKLRGRCAAECEGVSGMWVG